MPRQRLDRSVKKLPILPNFKRRIVLSTAFKTLLKDHPEWTRLTVKDWMPIACKHWKVQGKLDYKDGRYKKVNEFV